MRRYVGLVAMLAVAAAGCSSKERAGALPSTSPVPSATATVSTPATPVSEVEAAARAYYAALETAGQEGEIAPLRAAVASDCECVQQVAALESEKKAGRRVTTRYVVDAVRTHDVTATTGWATVTLTYAESAVVDGSGRVVRTLPGKTRAGRDLLFRKEGTTWVLTRLVLLG